MASDEVVKALAVCAELCGANLSDGAAKIIVADLAAHKEQDVLKGLETMRRSHDGRFSLAAILKYVQQAKRDRIASLNTCYICGELATKPGSLCEQHYDYNRKVIEERKRITAG